MNVFEAGEFARMAEINGGEYNYLALAAKVLAHGVKKEDRTGTGILSIFGHQMRFNMAGGFPLLTTKYVNYEQVLGELLAFIAGETNAKVIGDKYRFKIWKKWQKDESGDLGPIYGVQWRSWPTHMVVDADKNSDEMIARGRDIDQLQNVIEQIKNNPDSRRHIVSAWNVAELDDMALPPCHLLFQFYVAEGKLSLQLYQRSADIFLGVPYNIASYATLLHMVAHLTGLEPGEFIHTLGDAHIYLDHIEQMKEQLTRNPRGLPVFRLNKSVNKIDQFWFNDIELLDYNPYPKIQGNVSV